MHTYGLAILHRLSITTVVTYAHTHTHKLVLRIRRHAADHSNCIWYQHNVCARLQAVTCEVLLLLLPLLLTASLLACLLLPCSCLVVWRFGFLFLNFVYVVKCIRFDDIFVLFCHAMKCVCIVRLRKSQNILYWYTHIYVMGSQRISAFPDTYFFVNQIIWINHNFPIDLIKRKFSIVAWKGERTYARLHACNVRKWLFFPFIFRGKKVSTLPGVSFSFRCNTSE